MIIRHDQMTTLAEAAEAGYLDFAVRHMQAFSPHVTSAAGEAAVRQAAEAGLAHAREYGFESEGSLLFYLDLTILFGHGFDTDPQYAWMHPYLRELDGLSGFERSRLLHWHVTTYLHRVVGAAGEWAQQAIRRAQELNEDRLSRAARTQGDEMMRWMYPQRMPFYPAGCGSAAWSQAPAAGFEPGPAAALYVLITFLFGHKAMDDPLQPWLRDLTKAPKPSIDERLKMVQSRLNGITAESAGAKA
jgi:hypothetical protein